MRLGYAELDNRFADDSEIFSLPHTIKNGIGFRLASSPMGNLASFP
jgi:hypothetical protein